MSFKAKLRKIGNSVGIIIPKDVITSYQIGDEIELNVITNKEENVADNVITPEKETPWEELCKRTGQTFPSTKHRRLVWDAKKGMNIWVD